MSTDRDRLFLASNPSTSASTSSAATYGTQKTHSAMIPVTPLDASPLSNGTSSANGAGAQASIDKPASVGPARAKQQIIIHEFLNSNSGPFIDHHLPAGSNGQPAVNNSSITILTTAAHSQNGSSPPRLASSDATVPKRSTMVLDRINICINNHFNEPQSLPPLNGTPEQLKPTTMVSSEKRASTDLEPDSTTSSLGQLQVTPEKASNGSSHVVATGGGAKFKLQEDVLVEHKDGRFYLGTVIAIGNSQCLVRFNDNTECWSDFRELTKLSSSNEADDSPACVLCKRHNADDSVEVCENCGRGYHVKCMDGNFERNGYWFCRMCTSPNGKRKDIRYVCSGVLSESLDPLNAKSQLPYNIDSLTWDGLHRTNLERHYCYCGTDGDWLQEMIQCCRCQQWFHGRCIRSLQYPIFLGDRFYFFICSICNHGHEFVRRLEVSWPDLIHLALYNLIVRTGKRFFDVTKAIAAYVEDNSKTLQMSEQMTKLSPNARKEIITQTLTHDQARFRCGSEVKKAATMWTLRLAQPPSPPTLLLQAGEIITEHMLTQIAKEVRIYRFLPRVALEKSFVNDGPSRERMAGASYCSPLVSEEDVSEATSEDTNQDENSSDYEPLTGAGTGGEPPYCGDLVPSSDQSGRPTKNSVAIYASTGKTASSNLSDSLFSSNAKDGFQLFGTNHHHHHQSGGSKDNRRAFKSRPKKTDSEKSFDIYDSSDDTSRNTLDLIIPPPKDFTGKNNPFHQPTTASNGSAAVGTAATTAISGPGGGSVAFNGTVLTPPMTSAAYNETKDLMQKASSTSNGSHLSSNLVNGEMRVARIVKRRLSARDILIGTKYKRRKFRKSSVIGTTITAIPAPSTSIPVMANQPSSSLIASLFSQPLPDNGGGVWPSSSSSLLPSTSSSGSSTPASCSYLAQQQPAALVAPQPLPAISCSSAADGGQQPPKRSPAHGRRLRQRQERNYAESTRRTSIVTPAVPATSATMATGGSPLKSELVEETAANGSSNDLQSSLNQYFGATHRILSGEKFVVHGKRVSLSGKVQYLIEWEGCPAPVINETVRDEFSPYLCRKKGEIFYQYFSVIGRLSPVNEILFVVSREGRKSCCGRSTTLR